MWLGTKLTALSDYLFRTFFRVLFRYDIFISYARRDGKDYAFKLHDQLKQLDFSCFIDRDGVPAGSSLNRTLQRAVRSSATLVVVGTERAVGSRYVELEVGEFAKTERAIIPIDIEGSLAAAPWPVVRERDLVWIDETRAALERGVPSPNVADQLDKLFKYTRRNSRVRAQVLATLLLFLVGAAASVLLIRQQVSARDVAFRRAEQQEAEARTQTKRAEESAAVAEARAVEATRAQAAADDERQRAEQSQREAEAAELKAGEAAAEARRQEAAALASAARAREEQKRAEAERERAEERTRYVRAQQAGVHAGLAFDAGEELERSVLLSVESLKRSLTPEGYIAWARSVELLPRPHPSDFGPGGKEVTALAYSPDGRWLAEGGTDGSVTLRRAGGSGQPVSLRLPGGARVRSLAFVRGGAWVAAESGNEFGVWDVNTKERKASQEFVQTAYTVTFSPDGRHVAASSHEPLVRVYDTSVPSKVIEANVSELVRYSMSLAFSPDGQRLVAACVPGKLLVWETAGLAAGILPAPKVFDLSAAVEVPRHVAFGPDGQHLATLSLTGEGAGLVAWRFSSDDAGNLRLSEFFRAPIESIPQDDYMEWSLAFSPDGAHVAAASKDSTARVWDVSAKREVLRVGFGQDVDEVAFSPDGRALATLGGGVVGFWKTEFGASPVRLAHGGEVEGLSFSPGREWLAAWGAGGVRLFRASDWTEAAVLPEAGNVEDLAFSPDGRWLVAEGKEKVVVYDVRTWRPVKEIGDLEWQTEATFDPDSCRLVLATGTLVRLFECDSWRESRTLRHSFPVTAVAFAPGGRRLSVAATSGRRRGFKQVTRTYVWEADVEQPAACGASVDEHGQARGDEPELEPGTEGVPCPDVEGNPHAALLKEAQGWARSVKTQARLAESPDGLWVGRAEPGRDFELAFREGNAFRAVARPKPNDGELGWTFTPDGRWLAVAEGRQVTLWPLRPADMIAEACARLRRRELTEEERQKYFSGEQPALTCGP